MSKIVTILLLVIGISLLNINRTSAHTILGYPGVCAGGTTSLSDAAAGGIWSSGSTGIATVDAGGIVSGVAAGTATITYDVAGDIATVTVTVSLSVNAGTITGPSSVCVGSTAALTDAVSGGSWSSSNTLFATVGSTGIVNGLLAGTVTIYYSITNGCGTATATRLMTINSGSGSAGTISGSGIVCIGSTTALTDATPGGTWSSITPGVATVGATGIVTGISAGTSMISYAVVNSCGILTAATKIVTVNALTSAGTISGTATVCSGSTTALTDLAGIGTWSSSAPGIASVGATGIVTGVAAGTATISFSIMNSCGVLSVATRVITVSPLPVGGTITGTRVVCTGATTSLGNATGTAGGTWSSSLTTIAVVNGSGVVTGVAPGTTTISYIITNGCGTAQASAIVTVNGSSAGTITGIATVCAGATTALTNTVTGGTWSSGTLSVATVNSVGVVTGVAAGTTTISYSITSSCGVVRATQVVTVNSSAAGTITGTMTLCSGATTALTNTVAGGTWSSAAPSIATVDAGGIVTGVSNGSVTITYTVSNLCGTSRTTAIITVGVASVAPISGPNNVVTGGTITLTDATPGGTWTASNGNATVSGSGVVTGVAAGAVVISYAVVTSCGTVTTTKTIMISVATVSPITGYFFYLCEGATASFFDYTTGGSWSVSPVSVATISPTGVVTGMGAGTATISYTLGTSYATAVVSVYATPSPIVGPDHLCIGSSTALTDPTPGGTWSSGLPSKATITSAGVVTAINHSHIIIPIYYTIAGALCRATHLIVVDSLPGAIMGPSKVCAGSTITLSDTTRNGYWSTTSTNATIDGSGNVTGVAAGTAGITFTSNSTGCMKILVMTVNPAPAAISGTLSVCTGRVTFVSDATTPGISWTSSSPAVATISGSGAVTGVSSGTTTITYMTATACKVTAVVTVNTTPTVTPILGPSTVSRGGPGIDLSDATTGGVWTSANTAMLTVGSTTGHVTAVVATGSNYINYTVTSPQGCAAAVSKYISTSPAPHANGGTTTVGTIVNLDNEATGGEWTSSDDNIATVDAFGNVTALTTGSVQITHAVTNPDGTIAATITQLAVNAHPFEVKLVPNPNSGSFTISGSIGTNKDEMLTVEITNMLGQVVYNNRALATGGVIAREILMGDILTNGMYVLNVKSASGSKTVHFVIER